MIVAETLGGPPSNDLHVQRSLMLRLHVKKGLILLYNYNCAWKNKIVNSAAVSLCLTFVGRCIITIEKQPFGHTLDQHLNAPVANGREVEIGSFGPLQSMYLSSCCCPLCTSVLLHSVLVCWRRSVLQTVVVRREDRTYHDRHFLFGFISISLCSRVLYQISIHQMLLCSVCASFSLFLSEQFFFLDM